MVPKSMKKPPKNHPKIDPEIDPEKVRKRSHTPHTQNIKNPPKPLARATNLSRIDSIQEGHKLFQKVNWKKSDKLIPIG